MDLATIVPQLGLSGIFAFAVYKLYNDMRDDSKKREELLLNHLEKVADTLEKIDERLSKLEGGGRAA